MKISINAMNHSGKVIRVVIDTEDCYELRRLTVAGFETVRYSDLSLNEQNTADRIALYDFPMYDEEKDRIWDGNVFGVSVLIKEQKAYGVAPDEE